MINLCFQLGDDRSRTCTDGVLISRSDYEVNRKPLLYRRKKTKTKQKPLLGLRDPYRKTKPKNIFKGLLIFSSKTVV